MRTPSTMRSGSPSKVVIRPINLGSSLRPRRAGIHALVEHDLEALDALELGARRGDHALPDRRSAALAPLEGVQILPERDEARAASLGRREDDQPAVAVELPQPG